MQIIKTMWTRKIRITGAKLELLTPILNMRRNSKDGSRNQNTGLTQLRVKNNRITRFLCTYKAPRQETGSRLLFQGG